MRLNLEVNAAQMASLKKLQSNTGASTMKDLVNNALSVLEWVGEEMSNDNEIAAVNEQRRTYRVLVSPLLLQVKDRAKQNRTPLPEPTPQPHEEPIEIVV